MKISLMIETEFGDTIAVPLTAEGDRESGKLIIDGVPYHIERIEHASLRHNYLVDRDRDYDPQHDKNGMCVVIAPYSKK